MTTPIKYDGAVYRQRLAQLAREWLNVRTCHECGSPRRDGFVCIFCGDLEEATS